MEPGDEPVRGPEVGEPGAGHSNVQPLWRLALLVFVSYGLYQFYWFWRNWRDLGRSNPGWRAAGLLVPVLNLFLIHDFFMTVEGAGLRLGFRVFSAIKVTLAFIGLNLFATTVSLLIYPWKPSNAGQSLSLFAIEALLIMLQLLPVVYAQGGINLIWLTATPGRPVRTGLNRWEIVWVVVFAVVWQLSLMSVLVPGGAK